MKRFAILAAGALLVAGCHKYDDLQRKQRQYDVVQEGQSGASSTINAPGETPPPASTTAMNGTSVDTTTSFTLPNGTTAPTTTGNLASTMTAPAGNVATPSVPQAQPPVAAPTTT